MFLIKYFWLLFVLVNISQNHVSAQTNKAQIWLEPAHWTYEKIELPLDFAPDFNYSGFEELRFSPNMFDTLATDYFTYLFAMSVESKTKLKTKELQGLLNDYYKGLCHAVASSRKMNLDTSLITITLSKSKTIKGRAYDVDIVFYDAFTNGQKILLHMELEVIRKKESQLNYIVALVSPQPKSTAIWAEMHQYRSLLKL